MRELFLRWGRGGLIFLVDVGGNEIVFDSEIATCTTTLDTLTICAGYVLFCAACSGGRIV